MKTWIEILELTGEQRKLFALGRKVNDALPRESGLRPNDAAFKKAADKLGIKKSQAIKAWNVFSFDEKVIAEKKTEIAFIADQLTNDENSTDAEMIDHLAKETNIPVAKISKLVKSLRGKFLKEPLMGIDIAKKLIKKHL